MKFNRMKNSGESFLHFHKTIYKDLSKILVLLTVVLLVASCSDSASERAGEVGGITARQLVENPNAYVGKTITVSGEVEEILDPRAFTMDAGANDLLIVGRQPYPQVSEAGNRAYLVSDVATVTGVFQLMNTADVEREIGWDIAPELESRFAGKPVIVAQQVSFRPGAGGTQTSNMNADAAQPMANTEQTTNVNSGQDTANTNTGQQTANTNTGQQTNGNLITDPGVFTSTGDKTSLVNREAEFTNVRVVRVLDPRAFTIPSGNGELYVVLNEESERGIGTQGKINRDDTLSVRGTFKRLDDQALADISNRRIRPLTNTEREYLKNTQVFLLADQISNLKSSK